MSDNRPVDRLQAFLAAIAGDESAPELEPRDQLEYYLARMAERVDNIQPGGELTEFTANWLSKTEQDNRLVYRFTTQSDAGNNWPDHLSVVVKFGDAPASNWRSGSYARYSARTSGWTAHTYTLRSITNNTGWTQITIDGVAYAYFTISRSDSDAAFAEYLAGIEGGLIDYPNNGGLKLANTSYEHWLLDVEVTADNIADIVNRLPAHEE